MISFLNKAKSKQLLVDGDHDFLKLISYEGLKESPDFIAIDGKYFRSLYISGYPFVAHSGWMDVLVKFNHNVDISMHLEEVEADLAMPKLQRKITELESTKRSMIRDGKIIGADITDPLESAIDIKNKIQRGQEKLFLISLYIGLSADTKSELDKITKVITSNLASKLFFVKTARFQQLEGLQSLLPRAEDSLRQVRNMDSTTASLCFPFMSSEFVQESGILYGINKSNNSLVIVDRFALNNANSITFAQSGSGKSYTSKVEIIRQLAQGTDVIVIDPEREYANLAESMGGTVIKLSINSDEHINPFDVNLTGKSQESLMEHVQDLTDIISLLTDGMTSKEKALTDKLILKTYSQSASGQPTLKDFYDQLVKANESNLSLRLEKYITGSLAGVLSQRTNVNLDNRLVVFDTKDLPQSLNKIMMVVIASYVQNRVKADIKKRLLVIDEAWMLLENQQSAVFIANLVRRARKYWLGVAIISQQANDFLENGYGQAIASQSAMRILMRQDSTTIENVAREFQLSEFEYDYLLGCDKGDALFIADQNHVALSVVASEEEHPLITTDPKELFVQNL